MVLIPYVCNDDGIYGSPTTMCEPEFTYEMLNLSTPSQSEKPAPPSKIATSEFQFQQMNRRSIEKTGKSIDQQIQTELGEEHCRSRSVRTLLADGEELGQSGKRRRTPRSERR